VLDQDPDDVACDLRSPAFAAVVPVLESRRGEGHLAADVEVDEALLDGPELGKRALERGLNGLLGIGDSTAVWS